ncbi:16S rRNA (cytidine(1402)-2'-O)-methyltransferase [candidate division WOR-1 bacterium RIFOXYA12_FULL_52_29]|uniref:Ribosomal RNA small subunit methyltransferase I n=1 Tax=candidate division WOR-1 bacterium RIFOXYC12_FULL_54_18 TaxID=1802584 RepID=A0A1F4T756_UNCSA|nr:MAG: 16S rRNA (cytidine(1402)-2'-O)-methyltransferase [candidate division WOR-1 bacterium RIFOXYA2_FULL_51_19]OGC18138.1 MAG: 16S rRNA (cytidine(1402)-2'-O)-methyltransferase [candidate division WOR-1 bacterium RIFOXYA12_FULL_52_29]OGC26993.1 MAG: 16S rRNA (cytidine(1402)-2'-O)-methyltransferase [candidate division WOR-1 bacterium RIFOXYB2_FULL_45_9]OGC28555.1 MAG: 16S rRNA (cytidine(1402)-2'-O)-methyltransferase [candidate division WOR-1 bacterium RIFOXYC12_FULL_54_18]OGC30990.1 MAG: 16S rR
MAGILYVVATPIGNLEDLTYRAKRILSEVCLIAAEDTRQSKILLNHYEIKTPLTSYHRFNIMSKSAYLLEKLKAGVDLALVTDSGTPLVSDPGYELVKAAAEQGIIIVPIPGASAAIAALSAAGLPTDRFAFEGFLPKRPGKKRKVLEALKNEARTIIIYESPFRLLKTLREILSSMGDRQVAVCRELTKKFEEIKRGRASEVLAHFEAKAIKGEIVIVVEGEREEKEVPEVDY